MLPEFSTVNPQTTILGVYLLYGAGIVERIGGHFDGVFQCRGCALTSATQVGGVNENRVNDNLPRQRNIG